MDLDNEELDATQKEKVKNMYDDLNKYIELYNKEYYRSEKESQVINLMAHDLFKLEHRREPTYQEKRDLIKEYRKKVEDEELIF